jgi:hypothetical protein
MIVGLAREDATPGIVEFCTYPHDTSRSAKAEFPEPAEWRYADVFHNNNSLKPAFGQIGANGCSNVLSVADQSSPNVKSLADQVEFVDRLRGDRNLLRPLAECSNSAEELLRGNIRRGPSTMKIPVFVSSPTSL